MTYLDSIASKSHTFILGDFNYPDINWHSLVGQSDLSNGFCDFIYRHNLYQLVSFPTHVKGNILDLILTTSTHLVNNLSPCSQSSMVGSCSDHFLLNFTVNISLALHRPVGCYKKNSPYHSKIDYEGLTNYFLDYDFSSFYGIPSKVWWFTALALYQPVHHLFSLCFSKSYIPQEWRIHQIILIPKTNNNNTSVTNYRPISLLCCISKVLEKIIFDKSIDFLTTYVISSSQFGFVKKRSTVQQLLTFSFVFQSLDHKTQVDTIYLDIRKAFDNVPHSELLARLWSAGIVGKVWEFFKAYLSDHQQFVSIDGCSSSLLPSHFRSSSGQYIGPYALRSLH